MSHSQSMRMSDPVTYELHKSLAKRDIDAYVPQLIELMNWNSGVESILDYGCGAGSVVYEYLLPIAKTKDALISGIDISNEMIQFAINNYTDPRINFSVGDIMDEEYLEGLKANYYDKIFSIYVVQFLKDYRKAFERFHKILTPDGEIGFTVVTKSFVFNVFEALSKDAKWSKYMEGIENWIPEWAGSSKDAEVLLENSLEAAGFKMKYLKTNACIYTAPVHTIVALFVSINPFLWRVPENLMPDLKEFHKKLLLKQCKINAKKKQMECDFEYEMIVCLAKKI